MAEKRAEVLGVIGVLLAAVGVVIAVFAWRSPVSPPPASGPTVNPAAVASPSPSAALPSPSAAAPANGDAQPIAEQGIALDVPKEDLSHLELSVARGSNGSGWDVGEHLYALNDDGHLSIDLAWAMYDADGQRKSSNDSCQIVLQLDGPGDQQRQRSGSCRGQAQSFFHGWPNVLTVAGVWTATATDELTGLSSAVQFTVLNDRNG